MNQNENKGGIITTENGTAWNVKVTVSAPPVSTSRSEKKQTKIWEIKVILN